MVSVIRRHESSFHAPPPPPPFARGAQFEAAFQKELQRFSLMQQQQQQLLPTTASHSTHAQPPQRLLRPSYVHSPLRLSLSLTLAQSSGQRVPSQQLISLSPTATTAAATATVTATTCTCSLHSR